MTKNSNTAAQYNREEGRVAPIDSRQDTLSRDLAEEMAYEPSYSVSNNIVTVGTNNEVVHSSYKSRKRIDGSMTPPHGYNSAINNAVNAFSELSLEEEEENDGKGEVSADAVVQHSYSVAIQSPQYNTIATVAPNPYPHFNRFPISAPMATRGSFSYKGGRKIIINSQPSSLQHSASKESFVSSAEASETQSEDAYGEREVCRYFLRTGMCGYGDKCRYLHPKTAPKPNLNAVGYPMRDGEHACPFYMKNGWCGFGATCKFNHPEVATVAPQHMAPIPAPMPPPPPPPHPTAATVTTAQAIATVPYPVAAPGGPMNYALHHIHPHTTVQHSIYYPVANPSMPLHHLHHQGGSTGGGMAPAPAVASVVPAPTTDMYAIGTASPQTTISRPAQVAPMPGYVPHYVNVSSMMNHSWPMHRMEQHTNDGNNSLNSIDTQQQYSYVHKQHDHAGGGNVHNNNNNGISYHYHNQQHPMRGEIKYHHNQQQNFQIHETIERSKSVGDGLVNISSDGGRHHVMKYKGVNVSQKEYVMATSDEVSGKEPLSQSSNASTSVAIN